MNHDIEDSLPKDKSIKNTEPKLIGKGSYGYIHYPPLKLDDDWFKNNNYEIFKQF